MVQPWVADYSMARPGAAALQAAGAVGVIRYLCPGRLDGVNITADEIADFDAHALPYGIVVEYAASWILGGYQSGLSTAQASLPMEAVLGIPRGVTFAAVDFDIAPAQFGTALETLRGMADGYGGWQYVGVYGSKGFCEWVGANSQITRFWSTDAWSNYTPAANAALHQHAQWPAGTPVVQGCDHNLILGDWAPRTGEEDMTPEQANILNTCAKAIVQLGGAITTLQTKQDQFFNLVVHGDPTHYSLDHLSADVKTLLATVGGGGTADPSVAQALAELAGRLDNLTLKAAS